MIVFITYNSCKYHGVRKRHLCLECNGKLRQNHFSRTFSCLLCEYKSSCSWSFFKHAVRAHSHRPKVCQPQFRSVTLSCIQSCVCGFKSRDGMKIAKHLVNCKTHPGSIKIKLPVHTKPRKSKNDTSHKLSLNMKPKFHPKINGLNIPSRLQFGRVNIKGKVYGIRNVLRNLVRLLPVVSIPRIDEWWMAEFRLLE